MGLNDAQKEAVYSNANKILCLAGAGTGKTYTMISRIEHLVEDGADPESILVLTFTNAAAFEMKSRYSLNTKTVPNFRTFHGFCYSLLVNDESVRNKLGYLKVPDILEPDAESKMDLEISTKLSINIKSKNISNSSKQLFLKYKIKQMKSKNVISFDYLCQSVCKLFENDDSSITCYKKKYKYVFVDEFQDTDELQWNFVKSFTDSNLFVVGDVLQNIYKFRGTTDTIIKSLVTDCDWKTYRLEDNYRSTKQIVEYANEFSKYSDDKYRVSLHSDLIGDDVKIINYGDNDIFNRQNIVGYFLKNYMNSDEKSSYAILCRTNAEVNDIKHILNECGIEFNDEENSIDYILNIIKSSIDYSYRMDFLSSMLNSEEFSRYIRVKNDMSLNSFLDMFKRNIKISYANNLIGTYKDIVSTINDSNHIEVSDSLKYLFGIDVPVIPLEFDGIESISEYLIKNISGCKTVKNNLHIGTIHSSKGLEYDNVYILGVNTKSFRLDNDDNRNLYYVAVTRAKRNLYIFNL